MILQCIMLVLKYGVKYNLPWWVTWFPFLTGIVLFAIMSIFVIIGAILPFIQAEIESGSSIYSTDDINEDINKASASAVSVWNVLFSVAKMFLWTFGDLPVVIDTIIFLPMRITVYIILLEKIPFT